MENETNNSWDNFTNSSNIQSKSKKFDAMFSLQIFAEIFLIGIRLLIDLNGFLILIMSLSLLVFNIVYLAISRLEGKNDTHVAFHRGFICCLLVIKFLVITFLIVLYVFLANALSNIS
jgi:hypothetical protein